MNIDNEKTTAPTDSVEEKRPVAAPLLSDDGEVYDIPVEGSLGLLAMGYAGIMLWREKRYGSTNS